MHIRRPQLWKMVGYSFLLGGGGPLAFDLVNFTRTWNVDAEGLRIGVWSSFILLLGIAELGATRMMRAVQAGVGERSRLWTALASVGCLGGGVMLSLAWNRAMGFPQTRNQTALALGGGFLLLTGLIALASERVVRLAGHPAPDPSTAAASQPGR